MNESKLKLSLCHHSNNSHRLTTEVIVEITLKNNSLRLNYSLHDTENELLIPPETRPHRRDNLWQHTCCEAFIGIIGQPHYLEFNFSPSREWAAYAFSGYREGIHWHDPTPPEIRTTRTVTTFRLETGILLSTLPAIFQNQPLELGISTVLEDKAHNLSYLAPTHPPGNPDFHCRDQWLAL